MFRALTRPTFLVGVAVGAFLAVFLKLNATISVRPGGPLGPFNQHKWIEQTKPMRRQIPFDSLRYGNETYTLESTYLREKISVLCLVLVKVPKNAKAIQDTWGRHCNRIQLLNITVDKMRIPIKRSKDESSWVVLCKTLKQVPDEFKWVLIVYDYTFVLVENLRLFLAGLNHEDGYYLGHTVKFWNTVYNMGQTGYVLSKGSVDALKKYLYLDGSCVKAVTYRGREDYYLGQSLAGVNITPVDTRDGNGLSTFHPYNLYQVFFPGKDYFKFSIFPHKCCSPYSVAFQAIEGDKMYTYYYILYTLQLFYGGELGNKPPPRSATDDDIWKDFLKARDLPENISSEQYYKVWENIVDDPGSFARHMKRESFDYL